MGDSATLSSGVGPSGDPWELRYRQTQDGGDGLSLCSVDGEESVGRWGYEVPEGRDLEWSIGWEQGGDHYLFGLTSTRVMRVVADGPDRRLEVPTEPFPHHLQRPEIRFFVLASVPVVLTSVAAVGEHGDSVQRDPVIP